MLVVTRKLGESLVIGGDCIVKIIDISTRGRVKIAIQAPPDVVVDRLEVHEKKLADQAAHQ